MADFCFVHAADLHLDSPFKGIGRAAGQVAEALREASLEAFDKLVALCLERNASFLVLAGDLYDGPSRGLRAQLRVRDGLSRLSDAGVWTFIVHGNHDPLESGWSAVADHWPERAVVFPPGHVETRVVERDGERLAIVHGVSYGRREVRENLALDFHRAEGPGLQVGVLHCNVSGAPEGHAPYSPCSLEDLRDAGLDYWALGHIHTRCVLCGVPHGDEPWIVYPGTLQSRSPKPSELGSKGAFVVQVSAGRVADIEHVACDRVRFELVELDVGSVAGSAVAGSSVAGSAVAGIRDLLSGRAVELLEAAEGRSLVLRAVLHGRSSVAYVLRRKGAREDLLRSLREDAPEIGAAFCWWDDVADRTMPELDLAALAGGGDFVADVVTAAAGASSLPPDSLGPWRDLREAMTDGLPVALRQRAEQLLEDGSAGWSLLVTEGLHVALDELGVGLEEAEA